MSFGRGLLAGLLLLAGLTAAAAQGAPGGARPTSADEARDVLREILATPEFVRSAGPSELERWLAELQRWLVDLLRRFGVADGVGARMASALAWSILVAAVIALLVVLVRRRGRSVPVPRARVDVEPRRPSAEWVARVREALERDDLREAARCAYMAAVVRLEEQGVWRVDETRTPREYATLVPAADPRRTPFRELAGEFERAWYGNRPADVGRLWRGLEGCGCPSS